MKRCGQDTPARHGIGGAGRVSPALIGLEELDVSDIVKLGSVGSQQRYVGRSPGDIGGAGNPQIERLLPVGAVTASDIVADHEREIIRPQIFLKYVDIDTFFREDL